METKVAEIADRIFRFSTCIPDIAPGGFTFNQFLIEADEPLLFHCGMRGLFPLVRDAMKKVMSLERLRWISFGHVEADECGAMNQWLAAAPKATVLHSTLACNVSVNDLSDRPPRALEDGATVDLGNRRVKLLMTPHVPHNWEAIVLFEEVTRTLLCGDLLAAAGDGPAVASNDPIPAVLESERLFQAWGMAPNRNAILDRLAGLAPRTLASMHGSSFSGDGAKVLRDLAKGLDVIASERK